MSSKIANIVDTVRMHQPLSTATKERLLQLMEVIVSDLHVVDKILNPRRVETIMLADLHELSGVNEDPPSEHDEGSQYSSPLQHLPDLPSVNFKSL